MTITLGCFDANVNSETCDAYVRQIGEITRVPLADVASGLDKLKLQKYTTAGAGAMSVAALQEGLKSIGFFPVGAIDGIYGYRTLSAVRLFQEYLRSVEKTAPDLVPNGQFDATTQAHLQRWMNGKLQSAWAPTAAPSRAEYNDWLTLLENVKQQYLASPNKMLQKVNAYAGVSSTRKVAQWDFHSPENVHLLGVRRDVFKGKFEDIFVLLLNGLVFKFQGSTNPGYTVDPAGFPFLAQGQHDYHFGWHNKTYLALRPMRLDDGVLVVRSKADQLTDAALNNPLTPNGQINVHWGGAGMARDVKNWSEGCQVINGTLYLNPANELIDCAAFAAISSIDPLTDPKKTRGAYNVLLDLVVTLASDQSSGLQYMLLLDADLDLNPVLKQNLEDARSRATALVTKTQAQSA